MKKKLLTLASAVALFSNVSMVKADEVSWGLNFNGGASFNGGSYKAKDAAKESGASMGYNVAAGPFFGYNFTEMIGIETTLGFRFLDPTAIQIAAEQSEEDKKAKKPASKESLTFDVKSLYLELLCKVMPVQFDGGYMFFNIGVGVNYAMLKSVKLTDANGKEVKDDKLNDIVKPLNVDGIAKVGAFFLDEVMSASVDFRYTALEQADSAKVKEVKNPDTFKDSTVNFGAGKMKVGVSLGLNIAALMN